MGCEKKSPELSRSERRDRKVPPFDPCRAVRAFERMFPGIFDTPRDDWRLDPLNPREQDLRTRTRFNANKPVDIKGKPPIAKIIFDHVKKTVTVRRVKV